MALFGHFGIGLVNLALVEAIFSQRRNLEILVFFAWGFNWAKYIEIDVSRFARGS